MNKLKTPYFDRLGAGISFICLLHCILTPLLMVLAVSIGFWKELHILFALLIVPVTAIAAWMGYKHHHNYKYTLLLATGVLLIVFANPLASLFHIALYTTIDISVTAAGSLILIRGHYLNSERKFFICRGTCSV